jgi:phage-related protein
MSTGPQQPETPRQPKRVIWLNCEVKTPPFSALARAEAGGLLRRLQDGENLGMPHSRPMPTIGKGCHELRVRDAKANWRVFYRIDPDAIVIVEVVEKKAQQTPKSIIDLCKARLAQYDQEREES